jgi:uncharacterized protein YggE
LTIVKHHFPALEFNRFIKMAPLIINVTGTSKISRHPERAVVTVYVSSNGLNQSEVTDGVTRTAKKLQFELGQLAPKDSTGKATVNAPITHWSMSSISTGSYFVYLQKDGDTGKETRYTASTSFQIRFADFEQLGAACSNLAKMPFTSIRSITWQLTDKTKASVAGEVRRLAVEDAVSKAKDFAKAVGKHNVVPVEINTDNIPPAATSYNAFGAATRGASALTQTTGEGLKFEPEDVDLDCQVKVRFEAW